MALNDSLIDRLLQSRPPLCPAVPNGEDTSQGKRSSVTDSTQKDPSVEPDQSMRVTHAHSYVTVLSCLFYIALSLFLTSPSTDDLTAADKELIASAAAFKRVHNQR